MGTIWVREFTGGLDTRRMPETTPGSALVKANNGHVTRGGEFEKRAAFVPQYALPAGTVGLFATRTSLVVFGHVSTPAGLPTGIAYQRLAHPSGTPLARVLSADLYAGKIYAVGEFQDGSIYHFYDGERVTDWYDGRARASFAVVGGGVTPAVAARGSVEILGGGTVGTNRLTSLRIDGINLISAPVSHTGNNATTAAAVAAAINSFTSTPDYTATANGQTVVITAAVGGATPNGKTIVPATEGDFSAGNVQLMNGGADTITSRLNDLRVSGVAVIGSPILWSDSHEATAAAIAAAINSYTSDPEYTATAVGNQVNIATAVTGSAGNGRGIAFAPADGLVVTPSAGLVTANGADTSSFQPGSFVKTIGSKEYSVSGPNFHFSGVKAPTKWTTDTVGAGFVDMSAETSGSEELVALAKYQQWVAIFAERVTQIWYVDPDPSLNRQTQVLNNTGTISPRSVTQFGDNDLFYLDESGLRSLRARDSSNAAATMDTGVPVDTLIIDKLKTLTLDDRRKIIGVIEPRDGRFWLAVKDVIFVFSFFNGAQVSAWSTYVPSFFAENAGEVVFNIEDMIVFNRRVFLRSGNTIYVYGGLGDTVYDATIAEAWLPYLDANAPTRKKTWTGIDAALKGLWEASLSLNPNNPTVEEVITRPFETTFDDGAQVSVGESTHVAARFRTVGAGYAKLSSAVVHYEGDQLED